MSSTRQSARRASGAGTSAPGSAFHPPIRQIRSQCGFDTGITDSRDWRTSARSASAGSALIAASVTGFGIGPTACMSTQTQSPFSAVGSG